MEGMTKEIREWIEDKKSPLKQAGARRALADIFLSLPTLQHEKRVEVFRALDKYNIPEIIPFLEYVLFFVLFIYLHLFKLIV